MKVSIHQPNYMPWLGFFDKMAKSDIFVIFDDVQFPRGKKHFGHRNKIKTNAGSKWLTVPIKNKSDMVSFNDTIINYDLDWNAKHLSLIESFYKKAPFFNDYFSDIENILKKQYKSLEQLSTQLIYYFRAKLSIYPQAIVKSSTISESNLSGLDKILDILNNLRATEYITGSGPGSERYIDVDEFKKRNIELTWQEYEHPKYNQLFGEFVPYLSVLDLLFNHGEEAKEVI